MARSAQPWSVITNEPRMTIMLWGGPHHGQEVEVSKNYPPKMLWTRHPMPDVATSQSELLPHYALYVSTAMTTSHTLRPIYRYDRTVR